jgi:hypothetical protein
MNYIHAMSFGYGEKRGFSQNKDAWQHSLREMVVATGCNAVVLTVAALQHHAYSTDVEYETPDVMSMEDVLAVSRYIKAQGLKLIVKAMVNCRDGYWRAFIRFFDTYVPTEPTWEEWFSSYGVFVNVLSETAQEAQADMFCAGCEMVGTDHCEAEWRRLIADVRARYGGLVTYNCDKYQEEHVRWWDAVDVISSSGYYAVDTLEENFARIHAVAEAAGKPFLFMECGCPSRAGSEYCPNNWRHGGGLDLNAQARWYRAFCDCVLRNPWVRGTAFWDWSASRLYPKANGAYDTGYSVYGKPAEAVLKDFGNHVK